MVLGVQVAPTDDAQSTAPAVTPQVQSATRAMMPEIASLMARHFAQDEAFFAKMIGIDWGFGIEEIGKVLVDGTKIVGFFGLHHSVRSIRGRDYRITAMHGVVVDPAYRGRGTAMMTEAAVGDPDAHYIAWTANPVMDKRYRRLGFQTQNAEACLALPGSSALTLLSWPFVQRMDATSFDVAVDAKVARIFQNHRDGVYKEFLFRAFGQPLGLIVRRTYIERKYPVAELVYVNDAPLLRRVFEPVRLMVHRGTRTAAMQVNPAEIGFTPALARKLRGQYIFKSPTLGPGDFNPLYGELLFLA